MRKVIMAASVLSTLLGGCSNSSTEINFPVRPPELADCKIYNLTNEGGRSITVARCPNSVTTTQYKELKTTKETIVIDGVEYMRRKQ